MTAPTHIAFSLVCAAGAFSLASAPLHKDLPAIGCAIVGSLLPDIDSPGSLTGRILPFLSGPFERRWGHRTITHSLLALLLLSLLTFPLTAFRSSCYVALLIGYGGHLMADCLTKTGAPLFYPHPAACVFPGSDRLRVNTGSLVGEGILLAAFGVLLCLSMPVLKAGGMWSALRAVLGTQRAAYADYLEANGESVLSFEGRWRDTRKPVQGEALVLDANPYRFLIAFEGRVWSYGEEGDIIPDRSRVKATGRPIRVEEVKLEGETYQEVLERIPEGSFLSGRLECRASLDPGLPSGSPGHLTGIQASSDAFNLTYAVREDLVRLSPKRRVDANQVSELRRVIGDLEREFEGMQVRRPPVHYLKLREAQAELEAKKRELSDLLAPVRFTGLIKVRRTDDR